MNMRWSSARVGPIMKTDRQVEAVRPRGRQASYGSLLVGLVLAYAIWGGPVRAGPVVAYVAVVPAKGGHLADAATIIRGGRPAPVSPASDSLSLQAGDKIFLRSSQYTVFVRMLEDPLPLLVRKHSGPAGVADYLVPQPFVPGLLEQVWDAIQSVFMGADLRAIAQADSRGDPYEGACFNATGKTDKPTPFLMPILAADSFKLASGQRRLFVTWRGGAQPFSVELSSFDSGTVVAHADRVADCGAWLTAADLTPGRYRLVVTDALGAPEDEGNIYVVDAAPAEPPALATANLPADARRLYYADWLATIDGGVWTFEAQQVAVAHGCESAAVRRWLLQWAKSPSCPGLKPRPAA
jgi:hypothetical protein